MLVEVAWAAVKTKHSYYRSKYFNLRSRLGAKKAIVAIAHRLLKAIFDVIKHGAVFKDLGEDYLTDLNRDSRVSYLIASGEKRWDSSLSLLVSKNRRSCLRRPSQVVIAQRPITNCRPERVGEAGHDRRAPRIVETFQVTTYMKLLNALTIFRRRRLSQTRGSA